MVKNIFTILLLALFSFVLSATAQERQRVLLHIGNDGRQEAIPLQKGELAQQAISRFEKGKAQFHEMRPTAGTIDTLRWTAGIPKDEALLTTNFGWNHQDVAFQWFLPSAGGVVKEFWWRNHEVRGAINKGTVRAWNANSRLLTLPSVADAAANMGWYVKSNDGDGLVTPYKGDATDTTWKPGKGIDTAKVAFDPLGKEAAWLPGGFQFSLDSAKWQGFKLLDFGDSMKFPSGVPFGFTLQNDSKVSDPEARMEILSSSGAYPYHSIKFYENPRSSGDPGWHIRSYEWGMYVVVEYTSDRAPKIVSYDRLFTTLSTSARTVKATVTDDNPGGGAAGVKSVYLYYKFNTGNYDSVAMTGTTPNFTGTIPGRPVGDAVSYYVTATDVLNNFTKSTSTYSYTIFQKKYKYLLLWNGRTTWASLGTMGKYYMMKDSVTEAVYYDAWDVKNYGKTEVPTLMDMYDVVFELNGDGGNSGADFIGTIAGPWLAKGTATNPKIYFFADQDHGWISNYKDTIFADTNAHAKYFGVKALINQDYPYTTKNVTWTWKIDLDPNVATDPVFSFIDKKNKKDTVTFWYHPTFELGPSFLNWMDELTPTATAKPLFRDVSHGNKVVGLRNSEATAKWHTFYLAFDHMGTDFRSDTSTVKYSTPDKDPKYAWITDVGGVVGNVLKSLTSVRREGDVIPGVYSLDQNYPNPFNPSTAIKYAIGVKSLVTLKVYNVIGQEVATLVNESQDAGSYNVTFEASRLSTGVYFYTLHAGNFIQTNKMVLLK